MKNPAEMTDDQLVRWLKKTVKSLSKSDTAGDDRRYALVDRYTELTDEAKERDLWKKYCDETHASINHDAYDCMF